MSGKILVRPRMSISNVFAMVYNARRRKSNCAKKMPFFNIISYFFLFVKRAHFFLFSSARIDYYGRLLLADASHMMRFVPRASHLPCFCSHMRRIWGRIDEYGRRGCRGVTKLWQNGYNLVTNGYKMVKIITKWLQFD